MKTSNSRIERITKDVSTVVTLDSGKEFVMCGEIKDRVLDFNSVDVVYHEAKEFRELPNDESYKIRIVAFNELQRFC